MKAHNSVRTFAPAVAALLLVFLISGVSAAADIKFGKINYEVIQKNSKKINDGIGEIQKMQQEAQAKIQSLTKEVTSLEERLTQGKDSLTPQEKEKLGKEFDDKRQELESEGQALRVKMSIKQKSLQNLLSPLVTEIIAKVAKEEGLIAVFRSDSIAYAAEGFVDISDKVAKALDEAPTPGEPQPKQ